MSHTSNDKTTVTLINSDTGHNNRGFPVAAQTSPAHTSAVLAMPTTITADTFRVDRPALRRFIASR